MLSLKILLNSYIQWELLAKLYVPVFDIFSGLNHCVYAHPLPYTLWYRIDCNWKFIVFLNFSQHGFRPSNLYALSTAGARINNGYEAWDGFGVSSSMIFLLPECIWMELFFWALIGFENSNNGRITIFNGDIKRCFSISTFNIRSNSLIQEQFNQTLMA